MAAEKAQDIWKELRKPFPKEVVGHMQRGGATLDFVGHAAVTDRLNTVAGPEDWNWEPLSVDDNGLPRLDSKGNLWIKLTIHGVTRLAYGDGSSSIKELIGDALRNGAMRFGVALDLWSKEELESTLTDPALKNDKPAKAPTATPTPPQAATPALATPVQLRRVTALLRGLGVLDEDMAEVLREEYGITDGKTMTATQAREVIEQIEGAS
jgi:hypothetical protein